MNILFKIKKLILDILFPVACIGCGQDNTWLCKECLQKIPTNSELTCPVCKKINTQGTCTACTGHTYLDGLIITTSYESKVIQDAIHALKYNFVQDISRQLSALMIQSLKQIDKKNHLAILRNHSETVIIPIPLHKKRLLERGFNQSVLLGKNIAHNMSLGFNNEILKRIRYTEAQAQLAKKDRECNVTGVFSVLQNFNFNGKNVILVDDVATTCSTLNECAKILKTHNCSTVWSLVIARGS